MSNPHLHSVKSCPEKSRPIKHGGQLHGLMIAIEYNYKLDRKNYFTLWYKLGQLLLRQSHDIFPELFSLTTYLHSTVKLRLLYKPWDFKYLDNGNYLLLQHATHIHIYV